MAKGVFKRGVPEPSRLDIGVDANSIIPFPV